MKKKSFIVHAKSDNTEILIPECSFNYAFVNDEKTTVVSFDEVTVTVRESIQEVQALYEETEG